MVFPFFVAIKSLVTKLNFTTMARISTLFSLLVILALGVSSCTQDSVNPDEVVGQDVIAKVYKLGFSPKDIKKIPEGYLVERDIILTEELLNSSPAEQRVPNMEQYRTTNLVNATLYPEITMYAQQGTCQTCYSAGMIAGLDEAIRRYNAENLSIRFRRVTSATGANITMVRLSKSQERQGVLGSAGFPTAAGAPYNQIKMSGVLESSYGLSTAGIATIIAHEMGHCIGMRHTDYYNRAISCGGAVSNEGDGGVGAILIPGTPSTATASAKSWMLACTDGGDRPFNADDKTALNYLY